MACHGIQQVNCADNIVVVIMQGHDNTLSHCFQACKVHDSIESANQSDQTLSVFTSSLLPPPDNNSTICLTDNFSDNFVFFEGNTT
jgi:hypothetical protein